MQTSTLHSEIHSGLLKTLIPAAPAQEEIDIRRLSSTEDIPEDTIRRAFVLQQEITKSPELLNGFKKTHDRSLEKIGPEGDFLNYLKSTPGRPEEQYFLLRSLTGASTMKPPCQGIAHLRRIKIYLTRRIAGSTGAIDPGYQSMGALMLIVALAWFYRLDDGSVYPEPPEQEVLEELAQV